MNRTALTAGFNLSGKNKQNKINGKIWNETHQHALPSESVNLTIMCSRNCETWVKFAVTPKWGRKVVFFEEKLQRIKLGDMLSRIAEKNSTFCYSLKCIGLHLIASFFQIAQMFFSPSMWLSNKSWQSAEKNLLLISCCLELLVLWAVHW